MDLVPGVSLRSTPGFMLSPATAGCGFGLKGWQHLVTNSLQSWEKTSMNSTSSRLLGQMRIRPWTGWAILLLLILIVLVIVAVPVFLIVPFRAQSPRGLEMAYLMRRW